jgi:hypothetical protein
VGGVVELLEELEEATAVPQGARKAKDMRAHLAALLLQVRGPLVV